MDPDKLIKMFFCGDVMTGRGVDQIMPYSNDPVLYESYVKDARHYVQLAERVNGPISHPVEFDYVWGDALNDILRADLRIINLETSITTNDQHANKGINYRMHPNNVDFLKVAGIDCCSLANNHVLDWGTPGLLETMKTLKEASVGFAGAGRDEKEAQSPCILSVAGKSRVLVFSFGLVSSGIPMSWSATDSRPGINLLSNFSPSSLKDVQERIEEYLQPGDVVVASIHWGGNWGYEISDIHKELAYRLIDHCHVDVIHGHSSHHVMGIEVYKNRPIIYGCGDFLNDYEGIGGHESYRGDLGLMYFASVDSANGELVSLELVPTRIKKMQISVPDDRDRKWMRKLLNREGKGLNTSVKEINERVLTLEWN